MYKIYCKLILIYVVIDVHTNYIYILNNIISYIINVLKIGPDRPVRPPTGHRSSPVQSFGPDWDRTRVGSLEPAVQPVNRTNRPVQMILIFF